jgi:hypothetical protein
MTFLHDHPHSVILQALAAPVVRVCPEKQPIKCGSLVKLVTPGLVPGSHILCSQESRKTWMAGTSAATFMHGAQVKILKPLR